MEQTLQKLIQDCQTGNQLSFSRLCDEYYDYAYRLAFRMLCNEEDAADITQDTFLRVWQHIATYDFSCKFSTWLYTIVTRICIDKIRKRKPLHKIDSREALEVAMQNDLDRDLSNKDIAEIIKFLSSELSPKQRQIFVLRDLEGLDIETISEITGMGTKNIKSNLCHARKSIRDTLTKKYKTDLKSL